MAQILATVGGLTMQSIKRGSMLTADRTFSFPSLDKYPIAQNPDDGAT